MHFIFHFFFNCFQEQFTNEEGSGTALTTSSHKKNCHVNASMLLLQSLITLKLDINDILQNKKRILLTKS